MIINEEGTYTLKYTATDECGKSSTVDRELVVTDNSPRRTVLYTDGTLIINERQIEEAHNIELHGEATNVYIPFDPNGATNMEKYIFTTSSSSKPWGNQLTQILHVEIGSPVKPPKTRNWFSGLQNCVDIDLTNLDTSISESMNGMFDNCRSLTTLDLSNFDTSNVTGMSSMFGNCSSLTTLDLSNFDTSNVTNFESMFSGCSSVTSIDVSSFDTSNATDMQYMFRDCVLLETVDTSGFSASIVTNIAGMFYRCLALKSVDISGLNTGITTNMNRMFFYCSLLTTIYASANFTTTQVTNSEYMFVDCSALVGGAGTTWASNKPDDKTYAHIDGGTSNPGYFTARS